MKVLILANYDVGLYRFRRELIQALLERNDVLIAPLAYVNFNVPDHSIVIGNPGKIIPKENATQGYIQNRV